MPPVSRFGGGGARDKKKQTVIEKLKVFFEKYFGLVSNEDGLQDDKIVDYEETGYKPVTSKVAEEMADYDLG